MGKSRRNRGGASQRRDPIAKPVKPPADPELAALREAKILPVIQGLRNADPKSRASAATAITNLVQDARCRKLLLREQIVHTILTQTLTDASWESRAAGWGILQVLAQEEETDFCVHLFRSDILTAIEYAARAVGEKLVAGGSEFVKLAKAERTLVVSITASLVTLLTALAEAGDELLEAISSNPIVTDLLFLLIIVDGHEGDSLVLLRGDALACLMILTEDNPSLASKLVANTKCYRALLALKDHLSGDGVLACATLHNVFAALETLRCESSVLPGAAAMDDDSLLIPTLTKTVAGVQPSGNAAAVADATEGGWSSPIEQQQLALETLASIGTALISSHAQASGSSPAAGHKKREKAPVEGDDEDEDMTMEVDGPDGDEDMDQHQHEEVAEDDNMDQDAMEADMDMVTGVDDADQDAANLESMPVLQALIQFAIPQLTRIASLQPTDDDSLRLQGHALSALNNMAWSVSLVDSSDSLGAAVQQVWLPVARCLWQQVVTPILASDTADIRLATQVTGLAWALARTLAGDQPSSPLQSSANHVQHDHHRKFISLYHATRTMSASPPPSQEDPFQCLGVKCVGVLGQLALAPCPVPTNLEIATFLLGLLSSLPDTPPADAVEALNQLLDVYANEDYPYDKPVFWQHGLLSHLEAVLPKLRAMAKGVNKTSQPELRTRADEGVLNLTRFVAYKKKHRPQGC
ncbi:hypothetical protein E4U58_006177 [Claviceps cyperi]|nr:hypothetical protein E4U58_006177 [Claviceps cyperi]